MNTEAFRSPEADSSPEDRYAYMRVLAMSRLTEAIDVQHRSPGYRHFIIHRVPGRRLPYAQILLAENYTLFRHGEAEVIEVSLPIVGADVVRPTVADPGDTDGILVRRSMQREAGSRPVEVTAENYAEYFAGPEPLVPDFEQKLLTFQLVPFSLATRF